MNFSQEFLLWKLENDYRNVMDFAKTKAKEEQSEHIAVQMIKNLSISDSEIATYTALSIEQVVALRQKVTKVLP